MAGTIFFQDSGRLATPFVSPDGTRFIVTDEANVVDGGDRVCAAPH